MKGKNRLVFWQNSPSIHQAPLLKALSLKDKYEVVLVCQDSLHDERKLMGWVMPDYGATEVIIEPDDEQVKKLLKYQELTTIHIVTGLRAYPLMKKVLQYCVLKSLNVGIFSEVPVMAFGYRGLLKRIYYAFLILRIRRKLNFILAIGQMGVDWYTACGFPKEKTFHYAYFTQGGNQPQIGSNSTLFEIVFVGGLISRKAVDLLLLALSKIKHDNKWVLSIVGNGPLEGKLKLLSEQLKLDKNVIFLGGKENSEALEVIKQSDLLVLPSHDDGWGAVVSESLMCGVPVICSDHCGSATLLSNKKRGAVFSSGSVKSLTKALERAILKGKKTAEEKIELMEDARLTLSPQAGADYLDSIFNYVYQAGISPQAPWLN